jgi:homopolymeric O-antigen transport system permease protein
VILAIRELWSRRDLLMIMSWREIKVKYKQSVMGILWAVLMPIAIVGSGVIVRYALATVQGKPLESADILAVAVKATPWAFFVNALRFGTTSLINSAHLVTKVYLPRLIFPLASITSQLLDFAISSAVITLLLALAGAGVSVQLLWLPLLIGALIAFATSLAIIASAASLFFRDVKFLVDVFLTFAIFFTPVYYDPSLFGKYAPLLLINPVSPLLEGIANVVIRHQPPPLLWVSYSLGVSIVLLLASVTWFKKLEPFFAESI